MDELFKFLDIEHVEISLESDMNQNKRDRTLQLQKVIRSVPVPVKRLVRKTLGINVISMASKYFSGGDGVRPVFDLDEWEIASIRANYLSELHILEELTGRNLEHWRV